MEEQLNPLAVTHLLQYTLRSLCIHDNSQWVYAVFWRILPRNYPPPKWDTQGGAYDRSRGNRRNWILVWEDGFCNFAASTNNADINSGDYPSSSSAYCNCDFQPFQPSLQPELFFKMSHEIYNYGEGLIGKVAADHSHKWIYNEPNDNQEINFLSAWHNSADSHPRTWEAQFQSGIKTIALIAVREGVVQLGAVEKVVEDLSYVIMLRKKFSYIESIPGVLLPHPSSSAFPYRHDGYGAPDTWHCQGAMAMAPPTLDQYGYHYHLNQPPLRVTPSMSSLEALLSKLPAVVPDPAQHASGFCGSESGQFAMVPTQPMEVMGMEKVAKEEVEEESEGGECSSSMSTYHHRHRQQQQQQQHFQYHQDVNVSFDQA